MGASARTRAYAEDHVPMAFQIMLKRCDGIDRDPAVSLTNIVKCAMRKVAAFRKHSVAERGEPHAHILFHRRVIVWYHSSELLQKKCPECRTIENIFITGELVENSRSD